MHLRRPHPWILILAALATGAAAANGCSATSETATFTTSSSGAGAGGGKPSASGAGGAAAVSSSAQGSGGGDIVLPDGGTDAADDVMVNPCGSKCGPKELCDPDHLGLDDDCNGLVDEGCPCASGQVHFCFKGDPSYHHVPGCFDGSEKCGESGIWGPCTGGVHATPDDACYTNDVTSCHAIIATPFADVNLKTGTGNFNGNALPGSETWTVTCPAGVTPCPSVGGSNPADDFKPLQSGEYTVTYTKVIAGPKTESCTYPLFVGAPGLRVELTWDHADTGLNEGADLDLHLHRPNSTKPWGTAGLNTPEDCSFLNCTFDSFKPPLSPSQQIVEPKWFADPPAMPPTPVNWWLDTTAESNNTCYFAPRGIGDKWKQLGLGCHSPRLDLDNKGCTLGVTDPNSGVFCAPENINVDFPPDGQWTRIGVHYYGSNNITYDVHPQIKIFCNGALSSELGSAGFYSPEAPVTFSPFDGEGNADFHRFWEVADVAFKHDQCTNTCIVQPIYSDKASKTPFFTNALVASKMFAPGYPPGP